MKLSKIFSLSACAALIFGAVACEKIEHEPMAAVDFLKASDAKVELPALSTDPYTIDIKANFDIASLVIETVKGEDWCKAEFDGDSKIKVIPNDKREDLLLDKSAEFVIKSAPATKSVKIVYDATEVHFLVKRAAGVEKDKAVIVLAKSSDAKIEMAALTKDPYSVDFTANYDIKNLAIETVKGAEWCAAEFEGNNKIIITPNDKKEDLLELKTAEFIVKYVETKADNVLYKPADVKIKVTRAAATQEDKKVVVVENAYTIPAASVKPYEIAMTANYELANLKLVQNEGQDWCSAKIESASKIVVTPTETGINEAKTAKFTVEYQELTKTAGVIYEPKAVSFIVKRNKLEQKEAVVIMPTAMDKKIVFKPNEKSTKSYQISYATGFNKENVKVEVKSGDATWCDVNLADDVINITAKDVNVDKDMETVFRITSTAKPQVGDVVYTATAYEFTVARGKYVVSTEPTLTLTAEGLSGDGEYFDMALSATSVTIVVNTNQGEWSITGAWGGPIDAGITVTPVSGTDGQSFTVTKTGQWSGYAGIDVKAGNLSRNISFHD